MSRIAKSVTLAQNTGVYNVLMAATAIIGFSILLTYVGIPVLRYMRPADMNIASSLIEIPSTIGTHEFQVK